MDYENVKNNALLELSLSEVARLVSRKEVSPVELVDAALQRIEALNPTLHAFITVYEQAREVAKAAEIMMAAGHDLGPLHGVPLALKDNIALKGLRTTAGSKILADWIPKADATVATRLRSAGGIILGKLNMHEFAWGGTSDNPHYGAVRNPWNPERFPAGSSGGSGAAVASRMCWGAMGTNTGGSIRLPSALCHQRHRRHSPHLRSGQQQPHHCARMEHGHRWSHDTHSQGLRFDVLSHCGA